MLNRASRKLEVQPDLARKVIGEHGWPRPTIPADFSAFEAAVNTGTPARMEDAQAARELRPLLDEADARPAASDEPDADPSEPRGLLARLGGERGQSSAEMMGLLPVLIVIVFGALADRADRLHVPARRPRGARGRARARRATRPTSAKDHPYRDAAERDLPKAWRKDAKIEVDKDDPVTVNVKLIVPPCCPGSTARSRSPTTPPRRSRTSRCRPRQTSRPGIDVVIARLRDESGQASAELMGMIWWLVLVTVIVWQICLVAWTYDAGLQRRPHRQPRRGPRGRR